MVRANAIAAVLAITMAMMAATAALPLIQQLAR
jgi:hypothetical protein